MRDWKEKDLLALSRSDDPVVRDLAELALAQRKKLAFHKRTRDRALRLALATGEEQL